MRKQTNMSQMDRIKLQKKKKSPSGRYPPNEREGKSLKSDQVTGAMLTAKKSFKRNSLAAST